MNIQLPTCPCLPKAFSLVEALITIAIMGILAGIVVTSVSNVSRDTTRVTARQQQAAVQQAVEAWASGSSNTRSSTGQLISLETVRASYNAASTTSARFNLIKGYLDDTVADNFLTNTTSTDKLRSETMVSSSQYLTLDDWASGSYPKVSLHTD